MSSLYLYSRPYVSLPPRTSGHVYSRPRAGSGGSAALYLGCQTTAGWSGPEVLRAPAKPVGLYDCSGRKCLCRSVISGFGPIHI